MHCFYYFFALPFSFIFLAAGQSGLLTADPALAGADSVMQSSWIEGQWGDAGVDVIDNGVPDLFSLSAEAGPLDSQYSGPSLDDDLFATDHVEAPGISSIETGLDMTSLRQGFTPKAECLSGDGGRLDKRQSCAADLKQIEGDDPGLCPEYMNNIKSTTCCCQDAVPYDPETYPTFHPCWRCAYHHLYLVQGTDCRSHLKKCREEWMGG